MLANVTYDRSDRAYTVYHPATGEAIDSFPAGPDGRRMAHQIAVMLHSRPLYEVVTAYTQEHPYAEARAWRAAEIALTNGVTAFDAATWAVTSQSSEYGDYLVTRSAEGLVCDCPDFADMRVIANGRTICKHTLAVMFSSVVPAQY